MPLILEHFILTFFEFRLSVPWILVLSYLQVLDQEHRSVSERTGVDLDTVTSVSNDLHQLIPQAHACVEEKVGLNPQ